MALGTAVRDRKNEAFWRKHVEKHRADVRRAPPAGIPATL